MRKNHIFTTILFSVLILIAFVLYPAYRQIRQERIIDSIAKKHEKEDVEKFKNINTSLHSKRENGYLVKYKFDVDINSARITCNWYTKFRPSQLGLKKTGVITPVFCLYDTFGRAVASSKSQPFILPDQENKIQVRKGWFRIYLYQVEQITSWGMEFKK